jgi:hypothetical protein
MFDKLPKLGQDVNVQGPVTSRAAAEEGGFSK